MSVYVNSQGVPKLKAAEWALILKNEGDAQPYMLAFGCPCGRTDSLHSYNCYLDLEGHAPEGRPSWAWDGNWEAPTLSPSIQRHGGCEWHGFLRKGAFVSA